MASLAPHGFSTTLVVPGDGRQSPAERAAEIRRFYGLGADCGFPAEVTELRSWTGPSRLGKAMHDLRGAMLATRSGHDLVFTRDEFAAIASVLAGKPTVYETYRADVGESDRYSTFRLLCYRPALLGVVVHSSLAQRAFVKGGLSEGRIVVARNGWDPGRMKAQGSRSRSRRELGLPEEAAIVSYVGHVNARKGTSELLSIAALLPQVTFLVVGAVPGTRGEAGFRDRMHGLGVHNVRLFPRVAPPEVGPFLAAADCLIVPTPADRADRHRRTGLPMKIFMYMAAGRPILAPLLPEVQEVLRDGSNAVLVPPSQPHAAAAALLDLLARPSHAAAIADRALADAQGYTWQARATRLSVFLRERLQVYSGLPDASRAPARFHAGR
jgi:glycosyltransferase involved in cell wall biosynthesis